MAQDMATGVRDSVAEGLAVRAVTLTSHLAMVATLLADEIERQRHDVATYETTDGVLHVVPPDLVTTGGGWRVCPGGPADVVPASDIYMGECPNCDYTFSTLTDSPVVPKHWVSLNGKVIMFRAGDRR